MTAPSYQDLQLDEIGLGKPVRTILYVVSLLPFVGLVIGINYAFRRNAATRKLGWRLFYFALALHIFYVLCVCPLMMAWALGQ